MVSSLALFVFGFAIYYLVPTALLSGSLGLFFNVFFALFMGLFIGLILLSLNLQPLLERILVHTVLRWCVSKSMPKLILNNLASHRHRNLKSTLMYAMSVGFIIFIAVIFDLEMRTAEFRAQRDAGADMYVSVDPQGGCQRIPAGCTFSRTQAEALENHIHGLHPHIVSSFLWRSSVLDTPHGGSSSIRNRGHFFGSSVNIRAVAPTLFSNPSYNVFLTENEDQEGSVSSAISSLEPNHLSAALYSVSGMQSMLVGTSLRDEIVGNALENDQNISVMLLCFNETMNHRMKPLSFLDSAPSLDFSRFRRRHRHRRQDSAVGFPAFARLASSSTNGDRSSVGSVREIRMDRLMLNLAKDVSDIDRSDMKKRIQEIASKTDTTLMLWDFRNIQEALNSTRTSTSIIFS